MSERYHCEYAWLGGAEAVAGVRIEIDGDRFAVVEPGPPLPGARRLAGVSFPGFANAHSHAFHRVLRGRSERDRGSFWTWREVMYAVAEVLDPDLYRQLATAVYSEMVLAGYTAVGEFHYLHHAPGGAPYGEANAMGAALLDAASAAGIRITLLDACYLEASPGRALSGTQLRFGDASVEAWALRLDDLSRRLAAKGRGDPAAPAPAPARLGAAIHSLRAVPPAAALAVADRAASAALPLHVHLSEQPAENEAVAAAYGCSPAAALESAGALGPSCTAVHATHLDERDLRRLSGSGTSLCMCPTTERDLADGIGPAHELRRRGSPLCIGSDSQAVVDPFEELRALELDERLASGVRGRFTAEQLLHAGTAAGHSALGWEGAGRIVADAPADLVTVSLDSPRLAGASADSLLEQVVFAATAADVSDVVVSGRHVVAAGEHCRIEVAATLGRAVSAVLGRL